MTKEELKNRTKQFALLIIKLVDDLPNTRAGITVGNQIIRSGTSVGANYRTACRARSNADLIKEADELTAIFTASGKTARQKKTNSTTLSKK